MRRRLFNILAAVSLVLCIAFLTAWVRSSYAQEWIGYNSASGPMLAVGWGDGQLFAKYRLGTSIKPLPGGDGWRVFSGPPAPLVPPQVAPHSFFHAFRTGGGMTVVPFWLPVLISLLAVTSAMAPVARRLQRRYRGLCLHCGYDLRASTDRCPECGTAIPAKVEVV